jgi:hypothetical protein
MLPASGIPSADAVLFQIGCASPEFGNGIAWINIQTAGSAAMNVTGRTTLHRKPDSPGRMRRPTIATDTAAAAAIKLLIIGLSRMTVAGAAKISKTRINNAKTIFGKFSAVCAWAPKHAWLMSPLQHPSLTLLKTPTKELTPGWAFRWAHDA